MAASPEQRLMSSRMWSLSDFRFDADIESSDPGFASRPADRRLRVVGVAGKHRTRRPGSSNATPRQNRLSNQPSATSSSGTPIEQSNRSSHPA